MGQYDGIELDEVRLRGPRITLRPWQPSDAGAVHAAMQEPGMLRFLRVPDPYSAADADLFVTEVGHRPAAAGAGFELAVTDSASGALLGSAALRLPREKPGDDTSADIGYWIAPGLQGNGYAAEAAGVLAEWAFGHAVRRAEIRCEVVNLASARTALRAGFAFESIRRVGLDVRGEPRDGAVFVRTASDGHLPIPAAFPALPAAGLTDGVITLRATLPADTREIIELEGDGRTVEVGFTGVRPDDDEIARTCDRAALDWLAGSLARMSIIDDATGAVAGTMQLRKVGPPQIAGIGYGVHPAFRGRGYTARGLLLISAWAFADGGFARLELGAKRDNVASQRAAVSGGFVPDGVRAARLRNPDGTFSDEVRFALVAPHLR